MTTQAIVEKDRSHDSSRSDPMVDQELIEAVRQRVRAHPQAWVQEIAAMLELDGLHAPADLVQRIVDERHTPLRAGVGLVHAPPAVQLR